MSINPPPWRSGEVLAFTEHDGPGRPPAGPSAWSIGALAGVLAVTFVGVMATDVLCPEHRAWVQALGGFAVFASVIALVGLFRGWGGALHLTLAASLAGVAIGAIDATHSPTRGYLVAFGFGLAAVLSTVMAMRAQRLTAWDRHVAGAGADPGAPVRPATTGSEPVATTAEAPAVPAEDTASTPR